MYHPKKPNQIRVVFDSSAQHNGVSLNDVLLTGPDLNNTQQVGVLIRFRKEAIAFTADIEQMFYCFLLREEDRNFLRFLWFQDNDLSKDIVDYHMRVHVFGSSVLQWQYIVYISQFRLVISLSTLMSSVL